MAKKSAGWTPDTSIEDNGLVCDVPRVISTRGLGSNGVNGMISLGDL